MEIDNECVHNVIANPTWDNYVDLSAHYLRILDTIQEIRNMDEMNETDPDWMYTHRELILSYRTMFCDIRLTRPTNTDVRFRTLANESEQILEHLCEQIEKLDLFDIIMYYNLNVNMCKMIDFDMEPDDLMSLMSGMNMG